MSNSVDNRVVSMEFDNAQFERNVAQSLETLKHLDKSLDGLTDSSKKFDGVSFEDVANQIDSLANRFTFFGTLTRKVFEDISEGIINLAHKMSNFSTENITAGWEKYAEKTTSVQTIMSATGQSIDYVTEQLDRLNRFTDETSYNFTDMTSNIAKFTSQGINLDTAVTQMQGIATWAASAGQNAQSASRAMYNISQAMGAGSMKLIDWKSIQNANMATKEFKEQAIQAAVAVGTLVEQDGKFVTANGDVEVSVKNFEQTLQERWFDTATMEKVFTEYGKFADVVDEVSMATDITVSELLQLAEAQEKSSTSAEAAEKYERLLKETSDDTGVSVEKLRKDIERLNSEELKFSKATYKAAQEAKTFEDAINATKDAVSTAWMNVFETIFGNYEESRHLWTDLANWWYDIFAEPVNGLQETLGHVMNESSAIQKVSSKVSRSVQDILSSTGIASDAYDGVMTTVLKKSGLLTDEMISSAGSVDSALSLITGDTGDLLKAIDDMLDANTTGIDNATKSLEDYRKVAKDIWAGNFGSGSERRDALEAAGFDYTTAQYFAEMMHEGIATTEADLWRLGKTATNLTDEQRDALIKIREEINKGNISVEDFAQALDQISKYGDLVEWTGRELLFGREEDRRGALYDLMDTFTTVRQSISDAWGAIFGGDRVQAIRNVLMAVKSFTQGLKEAVGDGGKLQRTFQGLFAVLDIGKTALSSVWNGFKQIVSLFTPSSIGLGETVAKMGDWLVSMRDWIKENKVFENRVAKVVDAVKKFSVSLDPLRNRINGLWASFKDSKGIENVASFFSNVYTAALNTASSAAEKFGALLDKITEKAVNFYNTYLDSYVVKISDFVSKVASGEKSLVDMFSNAKSAVVDFFTILWNFVRNRDYEQFITDLTERFPDAAEKLRSLGTTIGNAVSNLFKIDKSTITTILKLTAALLPFIGALKLLKRLTSLESAFVGFLNSISSSFKAWVRNYKVNTVLKIAASIGILAASLLVISKIPAGDLARAKDALLGIMTVFLALTTVVGLAGKFSNPQAMTGMAASIAAFVTGIVAAVASIWILTTKVDYSKIWQALGTLLAVMSMLAAAMIAISKFAGKATLSGSGVLVFAASILLMVYVLQKIQNDSVKITADAFLKLAEILGILLVVSHVLRGVKFTSALGILLFVASLKLIQKELESFLERDAIPFSKIEKHLTDFIAILALLMGVAAITRIAGQGGVKMAVGLAAVILAIYALGKVAAALGELPLGQLAKGTAVVLAIGALVAAILWVMSTGVLVGKVDKNLVKSLIAIVAAIISLGLALVVLSVVPWSNLLRSILAVGVILGGLALVLQSLGKLSKDYNPKSLLSIIEMLALIGSVFAALYFLSNNTDPKSVLSSAIAISLTMLALAEAMNIIKSIDFSGVKLADIGKMALEMVAFLGTTMLALYGLSKIEANPVDLIAKVGSLAALMLSLSAAMTIISSIDFSGMKLTDVGKMFLEIVVVLGTAFGALYALSKIPMDGGDILAKVAALSAIMLSLSAVAVILSAIDTFSFGAALGAMTVAIIGLGEFALLCAGFGALASHFEGFGDALISGAEILGEAFGKFVGALAGGILSGATEALFDLDKFAQDVGKVAENLKQFDETAVTGAKAMGKLLLALGGAELMQGVGTLLGGWIADITGKDLGTSLVKLATAVKEYTTELQDLDPSTIYKVSRVTEAVSELFSHVGKEGGLWGLIAGNKSTGLDNLGSGLSEFGTAISEFADSVKDIDPSAITSVENATTIADKLIEMAQKVSRSGGLLQKVVGDQNIAQFGIQMTSFIRSLVGGSINGTANEGILELSSKLNGVDTSGLDQLGTITTQLTTAISSIPEMGGFVDKVFGSNDPSTFTKEIKEYIEGLAEIGEAAAGITAETIAAIGNASDAAKALQLFNQATGGIVDMPVAESSELPVIAENVAKTDEQLASVNTGDMVQKTTDIAESFKTLLGAGADGSMSSLDFGPLLEGFSKLGPEAQNALTSVLTSMTTSTEGFKSAGSNLMTSLVSGFTGEGGESPMTGAVSTMLENIQTDLTNSEANFQEAGTSMLTSFLTGLTGGEGGGDTSASAQTITDGILTSFSNAEADFKASGTSVITAFANGITGALSTVTAAVDGIVNPAVTALNAAASSATSSGAFFGEGFANGIWSKLGEVQAAAAALAEAAQSALDLAAQIASPSKLTTKSGRFFGQGFAIGMRREVGNVEQTAEGMANSAIGALSLASVMIDDILNSDSQPVITPILDLSEVRREAQTLGSLGTMTANVTASRANAISGLRQTIELGKNQNGSSGSTNNSYSNVINVYASPTQSAEEIAEAVERRMTLKQKQRTVAFVR